MEVIPIRWSANSPSAGDPDCLCSLCGELISGPDQDDGLDSYEPPIRMWDTSGEVTLEAQFHLRCFHQLLAGKR